MALLLPIFNGSGGLITVSIACELGQRLDDAFIKIDFTIDQIDWYSLPIEIKRMLPMVIANAQRPVLLECFGNVACTREVFKNVRIKPPAVVNINCFKTV